MNLENFDLKYMPSLVERVVDLWSDPNEEKSFRKIYVEAIIRNNMNDNDRSFMLTEKNALKSIAFVSLKGNHNPDNSWWEKQYNQLSEKHRNLFTNSRDYLTMMDQKTYEYMNERDIKLSLFISLETGRGKGLLEEVMAYYKAQGFRRMFLWTDCECNVDWYTSHGYVLVEEDIYKPWSTEESNYMTYVFKKTL